MAVLQSSAAKVAAKLVDSKAGISDERRPSMRERFDEDRLQTASETLAEAAPYKWGRTSLVLA